MNSYSKTIWANDNTPLNEQNMNKIEQGIKDAHDFLALISQNLSLTSDALEEFKQHIEGRTDNKLSKALAESTYLKLVGGEITGQLKAFEFFSNVLRARDTSQPIEIMDVLRLNQSVEIGGYPINNYTFLDGDVGTDIIRYQELAQLFDIPEYEEGSYLRLVTTEEEVPPPMEHFSLGVALKFANYAKRVLDDHLNADGHDIQNVRRLNGKDVEELLVQVNGLIDTVNSLKGGYMFRGKLDGFTREQVETNKSILSTYIQTLYLRAPKLGDVVKDAEGNEWYYASNDFDTDSHEEWKFFGQAYVDLTPYDNHLLAMDNPHGVTANQTGAYSTGETDALLLAKANAQHDHSIVEIPDLFDHVVPLTKLGGTTEGNIPLLDSDGLVAPQYIGDRYNDVLVGYGVFDDTDPEDIQLIEFYHPDSFDVENGVPSGIPVIPRGNTIYVTKNISANHAFRYSEILNKFVSIQPAPVPIGEVENTAFEGSRGKALEEIIDSLVSGEGMVIAAVQDSEGNIIHHVYGTKQELEDHLNATNPHGVTKHDVDLGNVLNFTIASNEEAEMGVLNTRYMTPASTASAIKAQRQIIISASEPENKDEGIVWFQIEEE